MHDHAVHDNACGLCNQRRAFRAQPAIPFFVVDAFDAIHTFDIDIDIDIDIDVELKLLFFIGQSRQHRGFQREGIEAPGRKRGH